MEYLIHHLINGIILGVTISLVALGFSLIYNVLKFINFAHGELMLAGGYISYFIYNIVGTNIWFSILIASIITGFISVLIERFLFKPLRNRERTYMLLTSLGITLIIQALISFTFDTSSRLSFEIEESQFLLFNKYPINNIDLLSLLLFTVLYVVLYFFIYKSRYGIMLRAVSSNLIKSKIIGINADIIISIIFFLSGFLASISGIILGIHKGLDTTIAFDYMILAFLCSVIAGIDSIKGIIPAGLIIGIAYSLIDSKLDTGHFVPAILAIIMTIILLLRNKGLFSINIRKV